MCVCCFSCEIHLLCNAVAMPVLCSLLLAALAFFFFFRSFRKTSDFGTRGVLCLQWLESESARCRPVSPATMILMCVFFYFLNTCTVSNSNTKRNTYFAWVGEWCALDVCPSRYSYYVPRRKCFPVLRHASKYSAPRLSPLHLSLIARSPPPVRSLSTSSESLVSPLPPDKGVIQNNINNNNNNMFFRTQPYFHACLVAYVAGLGATVAVMFYFKAAQPALFYLVPACLGATGLTALWRKGAISTRCDAMRFDAVRFYARDACGENLRRG